MDINEKLSYSMAQTTVQRQKKYTKHDSKSMNEQATLVDPKNQILEHLWSNISKMLLKL